VQPELAYAVLEIPEPSSLNHTFAEVIGLQPGEPTASGAATWRNDDAAQRIVVSSGPRNDAVALGIDMGDDTALDAAVARLAALGHAATDGDAALARERRVGRIVTVASPIGIDIELVTGQHRAATPFDSPRVPGGFATSGMGFGHAVFATTAFDEAITFAVDGLGFTQSDWLEMELGPGMTLEVRFLHCNPRHHTLAIARAPFDLPQRLHHLMVEMAERDDVGAAFDRLWATDLRIANGLGRHDNDGMFSFYLQTPAGFQVEVGHGARTITVPWTDDRRYDRISAWGHQPVVRS
jgi:2,3-dihydroxybiphenyl 1,2-dioxygenase